MDAEVTTEHVARAICAALQVRQYDDLPEEASYIDRKTFAGLTFIDREEARRVAVVAMRAMGEVEGGREE